jgi:acyl-CoA thioester hydrolase
MINYGDFNHIIPIQLRFSDIDRLDHVNNACYHNYVELGRVTYFNEILKGLINWDKQGFILARTEIDHLLPVFLGDEIYCGTKVTGFGNKSLTVKNAILKKKDGEVIECAAIKGILVAMDYVRNESILIPADWRRQIERFEK